MPDTTVMKNSIVGDDWIREACQGNPVSMLPGEGRMISSGPVRLCFANGLYTPRTPIDNPAGTPKYSVTALYTPWSDMALYYGEYYRICGEMFPDYYNPNLNPPGYSGLENPFHDGATKAHKFEGYTPGLTFVNHTSKFKPPIVDARSQVITDMAKVYSGVWAMLVVNAYGYGKTPPRPKKGVSFGIQAVMIIGDDKSLEGGGVDPASVFKGVNIKPPMVNPAALGMIVPPPPSGAPQGAPGRPPGAGPAFAPPGGTFMPPPPPQPMQQGFAHTLTASDEAELAAYR